MMDDGRCLIASKASFWPPLPLWERVGERGSWHDRRLETSLGPAPILEPGSRPSRCPLSPTLSHEGRGGQRIPESVGAPIRPPKSAQPLDGMDESQDHEPDSPARHLTEKRSRASTAVPLTIHTMAPVARDAGGDRRLARLARLRDGGDGLDGLLGQDVSVPWWRAPLQVRHGLRGQVLLCPHQIGRSAGCLEAVDCPGPCRQRTRLGPLRELRPLRRRLAAGLRTARPFVPARRSDSPDGCRSLSPPLPPRSAGLGSRRDDARLPD
jgi:hypothetical protein